MTLLDVALRELQSSLSVTLVSHPINCGLCGWHIVLIMTSCMLRTASRCMCKKKTVQSATISRIVKGFPRGSDGKESTCNAGDLGSISEWGRSPGERNGQPTAVFLCGELHGQRSLVGYCP